jgi:hypothetical protein
MPIELYILSLDKYRLAPHGHFPSSAHFGVEPAQPLAQEIYDTIKDQIEDVLHIYDVCYTELKIELLDPRGCYPQRNTVVVYLDGDEEVTSSEVNKVAIEKIFTLVKSAIIESKAAIRIAVEFRNEVKMTNNYNGCYTGGLLLPDTYGLQALDDKLNETIRAFCRKHLKNFNYVKFAMRVRMGDRERRLPSLHVGVREHTEAANWAEAQSLVQEELRRLILDEEVKPMKLDIPVVITAGHACGLCSVSTLRRGGANESIDLGQRLAYDWAVVSYCEELNSYVTCIVRTFM